MSIVDSFQPSWNEEKSLGFSNKSLVSRIYAGKSLTSGCKWILMNSANGWGMVPVVETIGLNYKVLVPLWIIGYPTV